LSVQQPPTPQITGRRLGIGGWLVVLGITLGALVGIGLIAGAIVLASGAVPVPSLPTGITMGDIAALMAAGATLLLADFTALLAWITRRSIDATQREADIAAQALAASVRHADIAEAALKATQASIKLQERDVDLKERQRLDALRTAFPHLRVVFTQHNAAAVKGTLSVLAGTALATDVKVWARTASGYYVKPFQQVSPNLPHVDFEATTLEMDPSQCPFPEFQKLLGDEQGWIGVTWSGPAGQRGKFRHRLLASGSQYVDEIEEVSEPGPERSSISTSQ
jgi:hypothetical protein